MSKTFQLSDVEKLGLENCTLKLQALEVQKQIVAQQNNNILIAFCERVGQKPEDIESADSEKGTITFKDAPEKKGKSKIAGKIDTK